MNSIHTELLEKIKLGEDSHLELKEVHFDGGKIRCPKQDDLADELAALANAWGGVLLLGFDDKTRNASGIPVDRLDEVEMLVRQACEDFIKPTLVPKIDRINLPDAGGKARPVIRVEIPRSLYIHRSPGGHFHRIGSSKRTMDPNYLARMIMQRSQARLIRFDETLVHRATLDDLDEPLWRRFAPADSTDAPETLLSRLCMAEKDEDDTWRPTVTGLLLACPEPQQFMPNAFIQAVAYRGNEIDTSQYAYQQDARDITGPLDQQVFDACHFVEKNMRVAACKGLGGGRRDMPDFDLQAVFEALVNAVAHRDYSVFESKVRLRIFDNRLELYIPGILVNTMQPEHFPYRQASRNEAVISLLARCPIKQGYIGSHRDCIMDKRGEGVSIILSRSEVLSGRLPEYRLIGESELLLTIYTPDTSGKSGGE